MSAAWRMVLRELWRSRLLFGAAVLLLAVGVGMFVSIYSAFRNLEASEAFTYEQLRFADVSYRLAPAPPEAADMVSQLPGVAAAEGRLEGDLPIRQPGDPRFTVVARIISLPEAGPPAVNDIAIQAGEPLPDGAAGSVLIDQKFAKYYGIGPGDSVTLVAGGEDVVLEVQGTFISPEYIWKAKSNQEPFVGDGDFAVIMARRAQADQLLGMTGRINEIAARFEPGADAAATVSQVTEALSPTGIREITKREDQVSYALLKLDLDGFGEIAVVVPALFLMISAMVIYTLLTRTVQRQRQIIGLMRAVGFSRSKVLRHFLLFPAAIALLGGALGTAFGLSLGDYITTLYADVIGVPFTVFEARPEIVGIAVVLALVVCLAAGLLPATSAANLPPSEAMRAMRRRTSRGGVWTLPERLLPLRHLPYEIRLGLRNTMRSRWRTLSSVVGVAAAVALVVAAVGLLDSMGHAFSVQFDQVQRYDMKVRFIQPVPVAELSAYESWDGVAAVEPLLELPVNLTSSGWSLNTLITALPPESALWQFQQVSGAAPLSSDGLFLADGIANALKVGLGDEITVVSETGFHVLPVAGVVAQPLSGTAYTSLSQAGALTGNTKVNGGLIKLSGLETEAAVRERLQRGPGVLSVEQPGETRRSFESLMGLFYQFVGIFIVFGVALGGIAVFNTVTINIVERSPELATMRTLGFSLRRVDLLLTIENLMASVPGVLVGLALGYLLEIELLSLFESESGIFSIGAYVSPATYAVIGISALAVVLLSQLPGLRSLHRLDLAAATKSRVS